MQNKYIHTEKDKEDDILFIGKFTKIFEAKFKQHLNLSVYNLGEPEEKDDYRYCVYDEILHQAETVYVNSNSEMLWLSTKINPNGVTENFIARTFTIKYQKKRKEKLDEKFYDYSLTIDDIIRKFELFLYINEIKIVERKMKSNTRKRIEDAKANAEKYINQMMTFDDKKLSKHIDLFRAQMEMAYKQKNSEAFELLNEYERQVIIARVNKDFLSQKKNK